MPISADNFNIEQIAQELTTGIFNRMQQMGLPEEEVQANANIIFEFAKIAGNLILQDSSIQLKPEMEPIQFEYAQAKQTVELFVEATFHAAQKCYQLGIEGDIKSQLLQALAQDVFLQAKQIVAATLGQEFTPEIQVAPDQQVMWINQTAEAALMHYLAEYEKQYGPIEKMDRKLTEQGAEMLGVSADSVFGGEPLPLEEMPSLNDLTEQGIIPELPPGIPGESSPIPEGSVFDLPALVMPELSDGRKEKYVAVALLVSIVQSEAHRQHILQQFNEEEQQQIQTYMNPEAIEPYLDFFLIHEHLDRMKTRVLGMTANVSAPQKEEVPAEKTSAEKEADDHTASDANQSAMTEPEKVAFDKLIEQFSLGSVTRFLAIERPKLNRYVQQFAYQTRPQQPLVEGEEGQYEETALTQTPNDELPPKVATVLYRYLERALAPQSKQHLAEMLPGGMLPGDILPMEMMSSAFETQPPLEADIGLPGLDFETPIGEEMVMSPVGGSEIDQIVEDSIGSSIGNSMGLDTSFLAGMEDLMNDFPT